VGIRSGTGRLGREAGREGVEISVKSKGRCLRFVACCAVSIAGGVGSEAPTVSAHTPAVDESRPWLVVSVTDGDTLTVAQGEIELDVRLIGVNAPEGGECWADRASEALADLVGSGPVWLSADVSDVDQYGRALRFVENADHVDVGALLVEQGHAIARSYPPDTSRDDRYALLQEAARLNGRGLWAPDACGPAVQPLVTGAFAVRIEAHPDAAGDDNENLNDEWVRFVNAGGAPLDLGGWMVKDESSSHRYRFGAAVLDPGEAITLFTGCGSDTELVRYWCNESSAVWNNDGDTVFLLDPNGNIVAHYRY